MRSDAGGSAPLPRASVWRSRFWLGAIALLLAIQITGRWYPTPDAVRYLSAARSLAENGRLIALGQTPGFPIGYSILVSPLFVLSDRPFLLISVLNWVLAVIFMIGLYRWFLTFTSTHALLLTGLVMVNVNLWLQYHRPLKEMAFLAFAIWSVQLANEAIRARVGRGRLIRILLVSLLVGCLVSFREPGIAFALGFGLQLWFESRAGRIRRMFAVAAFLVALAPGLALLATSNRTHVGLPAGPPAEISAVERITSLFSFGARSLTANIRYRLDEVGRLLLPGMFSSYAESGGWMNPHSVIYGAVFVIVALGWWALVRSRKDNFALALPLFLAVYCFWPVQQGTRFMLPMLPILQLAVWQWLGRFGARRLPVLKVILALHLATALLNWVFMEIPNSRACDAQLRNAEALAAAIDARGKLAVRRPAPDCLALSLQFIIDRPVARLTEGQQPPPGTAWLVVSPQETLPPGTRRRAIGPYYLVASPPQN